MKIQIAITDLTRMQRGCVCVAGYDREGKCYWPILPPPGVFERDLFIKSNTPKVYPFAVVEYEFLKQRPQPPHTEDIFYDSNSVEFIKIVPDRQKVLNLSLV